MIERLRANALTGDDRGLLVKLIQLYFWFTLALRATKISLGRLQSALFGEGQRCPAGGRGTLYPLPAGMEIRIDGHALLSGIRYELEKLRCSACGAVFTAPVPGAAGTATYTAPERER